MRGFRVELGEVEVALLSHPQVAAAVVVGRPGPDGSVRLAAYRVAAGAPPATADLRAHLRARLPEHMVPSVFVSLDALPISANGKLDRDGLPRRPGRPRRLRRAPHRVPRRRPARRHMARALGINPDALGVDVDFFDLGGHSLLAARMLVEVEDGMGVAVPLAAVIEGDFTVAGMAAMIEASRRSEQLRGTVELQPGGRAPALLLPRRRVRRCSRCGTSSGRLAPTSASSDCSRNRSGRFFDRSSSVEELAAPMLETIRSVPAARPLLHRRVLDRGAARL